MENESKKCSHKKHSDIKAVIFCLECKRYLCNKCQNLHNDLFEDHHSYDFNKNINEIFTGFCKEKKHNDELEYFCKTHNQLCCAACITKIKGEGNGQHTDCNICFIKEITDEKRNKLKENIKTLEDSINKLKLLFEKINENKEDLKLTIQKIFTKIRNTLNEREDILLLEVDKQFNSVYFNENIIKESESLPSKIKYSLEKGKDIEIEWNDGNKISSFINDCINIENNIKEINIIENSVKNCNNINDKCYIKFFPKEDNIDDLLDKIKTFGNIINYNCFQDSRILSSKDNYTFILEQIENNNKKIINYSKLIYRATRDGDSYDNFYNKINEIQNIILLIKSDNNSIFGGFTRIGFKKVSSSKFKDDNAFVFYLEKKRYIQLKKVRMLLDVVVVVGLNFVTVLFIYFIIFYQEMIIMSVKRKIIMKDLQWIMN